MKEMVYKNMESFEILNEGTYKNFNYLIVSYGFHPCAYVKIPMGMWLDDDEIENIKVYGGITFSGLLNFKNRGMCWYIGWDYALKFTYKKFKISEIKKDVKSVIDQLVLLEGK